VLNNKYIAICYNCAESFCCECSLENKQTLYDKEGNYFCSEECKKENEEELRRVKNG